MKQRLLPVLALLLFCSHDMFLKPTNYFLEPNTDATIMLFNGTFDKSENAIARSRMLDVSLVGQGRRMAVDTAQWSEKDSITYLSFQTGGAGTWVAGVSTAPRNIELAAADFNDYLEHDGVLDMLAWRRENGALEEDAVEQYAKHVKTLFQVGEALSGDWATPLGYPLEFIPLENPYDLHPGHALPVRLLYEGKPLANQLVYVGSDLAGGAEGEMHTHEDGTEHSHATPQEGEAGHTHAGIAQLRTDADGVVQVNLASEGVWYLRTIHMIRSESAGLTHQSNWATLTFAVGKGHDHDEEAAHSHEEEGVPSWVFWIGSLLVLGGLFLWFNRKK